jgi:membrane protease YdiL (CAAX protease family)
MGPEALWRDVQGQLLYAIVAVGGAVILPGRTLADRLGLVRGRLGASRVAFALLGFLALSHALHGAVVWLGLLEGSALERIDETVRETSPAHPALVFLSIGLMPALGEELLFRGFLLRLLASRWPGVVAVLGSALVFGIAHLEPVHGAAAFLLGGYLGAVAQRARSLLPTMLCHAVNNSLAAAGAAGLVPDPTPGGAPWVVALGLALAVACLGLALRGPLQPPAPPADGSGIPRGANEDDTSGPDRR